MNSLLQFREEFANFLNSCLKFVLCVELMIFHSNVYRALLVSEQFPATDKSDQGPLCLR